MRATLSALDGDAPRLPTIEDGDGADADANITTLTDVDPLFTPKKIVVLGAGAIGSVVGGYLQDNGHDVTLVDPW